MNPSLVSSLRVGRPCHRLGRFLSAGLVFAALMLGSSPERFTAEPPPVMLCLAEPDCFREAVNAMQRRETDAAVALLQAFISQFPETPWEGRAALLLGRHFQQQGDPRAVEYLQKAAGRLPLLADYAQYYLGDALRQAGDLTGAASAWEGVVNGYPDSLLRPHAQFKLADLWFHANECRRARDQQVKFLAEYPRHVLVPALLLQQGLCQEKSAELPAAIATYRQLWTAYAASPHADDAAFRLQGLREQGVKVPALTGQDWWLRGKTLFETGQYPRAIVALETRLKFPDRLPDRSQARLNLGIARMRVKQYEEAQQVLTELVQSRTGLPSQEAAVLLARVLLRLGKEEPLLALAREVDGGLLNGDLKVRFLLLLAAHHADRGRREQAISTYRRAGDAAGRTSAAAEAFWQAGWLQYQAEDYENAIQSFDRAEAAHTGGPSTRPAQYWKARSLEKRGEGEKAGAALSRLCAEAPNSYYCHSGRLRPVWQESGEAIGVSGPLLVPVEEVPDKGLREDLRFQRAAELHMLGWQKERGEELSALISRMGSDRGTVLWLARLLNASGEFHRALSLIQVFFPDVIEQGGTEVPADFWELAYPWGYVSSVRPEIDPRRVEPHLVTAVIREESAYNPNAVSSAGALGLMQVMPQTGQQIAARLSAGEFTRERLFDPCDNVRFGSWYLGQLIETFGHNLVLAIAAYNAGPEVVSKWVQQFGHKEPDEFIESIPYTETRQYVKKVLRSYRQYKKIYGPERDGRFLDKAC